jgi:thioredoxin 1
MDAGHPLEPSPLWVICLCAQWCNVCREWRATFDEAARAHPQARFAWIDVEDEDEAMGDVDIETFPTVMVARGAKAEFFGPIQPSLAQLTRLIGNLMQIDTDHTQSHTLVSEQAQPLLARLQAAALLKR